jgi:hypothetical protein
MEAWLRVAQGDGRVVHTSNQDVPSCCGVQAPAHAQVLSQLEAEPNGAADGPAPPQNGHESEALHAAKVASSAAVGGDCLSAGANALQSTSV